MSRREVKNKISSIIYFLPFFFVLNPALIMQDTPIMVLNIFTIVILGVVLLGATLQGYLVVSGGLRTNKVFEWPIWGAILISTLLFSTPAGRFIGYTDIEMALLGALIGGPTALLVWFINKTSKASTTSS